MEENKKKNNPLLEKKNICILISTYLIACIPISFIIFDSSNSKDFHEKVILMGVNIFVISPFVSIAFLLNFLRWKQFYKNKDIHEYLMPEKGSEANPIIDNIIGEKGVKFLNYLVYLLVFILLGVFGWALISFLLSQI